jgi:hypothetical protein
LPVLLKPLLQFVLKKTRPVPDACRENGDIVSRRLEINWYGAEVCHIVPVVGKVTVTKLLRYVTSYFYK